MCMGGSQARQGGDNTPISLSSHSHQLCAPPGRVSTLVCTQAREQPRLAREIHRHSTQSTLRCSGDSLCPPKAGRHALSETTWLASTYSHTTAMSTVRTEAGGAQGKAQAGNCLLLSVPITVHEQEWNAVRWRQSSSLEVCQRNSSRVSAEEQPGGFPDSTVLTARLRLRTAARQRPGVA